jgi:hypothetical protein
VAFEYGGVGRVWESLSDPDVLADQVPRLYKMVHALEEHEPVRSSIQN